jgi:hypothetical protein
MHQLEWSHLATALLMSFWNSSRKSWPSSSIMGIGLLAFQTGACAA